MLIHFDQQLLLFINSLHTPFLDKLMYAISGKIIWAPLYLAILIYLGYKYKQKFYILLIIIAVAITLSDQLSVLVKYLVLRPRPCHEPAIAALVHLVKGECGGMYSFVSSHASNSFNAAVLSLLLIRKRWYSVSIVIWASVVGLSRIYLGVHYPGDVLCGSILGILVGWSMYRLFTYIDTKILSKRAYFNPSDTLTPVN